MFFYSFQNTTNTEKNKNYLFFSVFYIPIIFLFSCNSLPSGFSEKNGVVYKLHQIGEGEDTPKANDYITINIAYTTIDDSLFFKGIRKVKVSSPSIENEIDKCFTFISLGDSTSFRLNTSLFFEKTLNSSIPSFLKNTPYFKISLKLLEIQSSEEFERQKQIFLDWIDDFGEYEKTFLKNYLEKNNIPNEPIKEGLYKLTIKEGFGAPPKKGDTLTINYEGRFLNGVYFDSTIKRDQAFEFVYGRELQVIKGIEHALSTMQEGEKSLFILPSELAFGAQGSSSGLIPPYTSVVFELTLVRVAKGDSTKKDLNIL